MADIGVQITKSVIAQGLLKNRIYNPNQTPASVALAEKHGEAFRFYKGHTSTEKCPCCGLHVNGIEFDLFDGLNELYNVGTGYTLYFIFYKYCIYLLLLIFFTGGLFGLITNKIGDDCGDEGDLNEFCVKDFIISYALCNKREQKNLLTGQLVLNFITLIGIAILFEQLRQKSLGIILEFDTQNYSPATYTLRLDGVPSETTNPEIISWLQNLSSGRSKIEIKKVTRTYKISEFVELSKQKSELNKLKTLTHSETADFERPKTYHYSVKKLDLVNEMLKKVKSTSIQKGKIVFVSFETKDQAKYVKKELIPNSMVFKLIRSIFPFLYRSGTLNGNRIQVSHAPEPVQIIWENVGENPERRLKLRVISYFLTFFLIGLCFMIVFFIQWGQVAAVDTYGEKSDTGRGISFLSSLSIILLNSIITVVLKKVSNMQKHSTFEKYLSSATIKLSLVQLINSAFVTLFAKLVLGSRYSFISGRDIDKLNFFGPNGLLEGIIFVFISNAVLNPILCFVDFSYLKKLFDRRRLIKKQNENKITQEKANSIFENPVFDMTEKYADLFRTVFLTCFYAPALPVCILLSIGGLLFGYWTDKYLFLKRNGMPRQMGHHLHNSMIETLEWLGFIFAMGNIAFSLSLPSKDGENSFTNTAKGLIWVTLAFSLIHIIIPMEFFVRYFVMKNKVVPNDEPYSEARKHFKTVARLVWHK